MPQGAILLMKKTAQPDQTDNSLDETPSDKKATTEDSDPSKTEKKSKIPNLKKIVYLKNNKLF